MDSLTARRIVRTAIRDNPDLKEALDYLFAQKVELGVYFERTAMLGSKSDNGKSGGRPAWPHWHKVAELDAQVDAVITAKTHRAQKIRVKLLELGHKDAPSIEKIRRGLQKR